MKRIGIFGGSFNPIHLGHTALAASICDLGVVDEAWLMVSPQNPLKRDLELLDENERLKMVQLAVAPYTTLRACDFEFALPRPSYTYHTLQALRTTYPDCEFSLIIGEDNWLHFNRWYRSEDILRETRLIVYPRSEQVAIGQSQKPQELKTIYHFEITNHHFELPLLPYSSTEIRHLLVQGESASHMLHPDVEAYIKEKAFYTKNE